MASSFLRCLASVTLLLIQSQLPIAESACRTSCAGIPIKNGFSIDEGCGDPLFRGMLICVSSDRQGLGGGDGEALFLLISSGNYSVKSIKYEAESAVISVQPGMSNNTCTDHNFVMADPQTMFIRPSSDTTFVLLNCSENSPVFTNHVCSDHSGGLSCEDLYHACDSFKDFKPSPSSKAPACCFTSYDELRKMSKLGIPSECTHFTSLYPTGGGPAGNPAWSYGVKLSYSLPSSTGCDQCPISGNSDPGTVPSKSSGITGSTIIGAVVGSISVAACLVWIVYDKCCGAGSVDEKNKITNNCNCCCSGNMDAGGAGSASPTMAEERV